MLVFTVRKVKGVKATVSPEDITRVKGLGFLHDKNTADRFNARVITRNGKITADEMQAITEGAKKFGNGEVTMTSRLTMEIQSVPYENIEPLREFLMDAGLETGGTGSKVRPVVSCKGTTCQYGLIDTFAISEEIHERFYKGYHDVKLPHKFKIAVGGCPFSFPGKIGKSGLVFRPATGENWSRQCRQPGDIRLLILSLFRQNTG